MSHHPGYQQPPYAAHQGYGRPPQTHPYQTNQAEYQHPTVVIPVQPRQETANFQTPQYTPQPPYQPNYYQQNPVQYQQGHQHRFYPPPQPQQYHQQQPPYPAQYSNQGFYPPPQSQPTYAPSRSQPSHQVSPQLSYQQQPRLPSQNASPQFPPQALPKHRSSPQMSYGSQLQGNVQATVTQQRTQSHVQASHEQQQRSQHQERIPSSPDPLQQMSPPRRVAHVEIPVQRSVQANMKSHVQPAAKRRRSNEGHSLPVGEVHVPASSTPSQQNSKAYISSPLTELTSSQMPPTPAPQPKAENQPMLLALADEYINAAYGMSSSIDSEEQLEQYHQLISMGMACLQSLLNNYRQSDSRKEARIRLRLATLMVDETENDEEAEEILSKGVALCERSRLMDLKYAMQHLSARLMAKRNVKAALKAADNLVREVETLRIEQWSYVFRFLRVSLSLQQGSQADLTAALKHLNAVIALAEEKGAVQAFIVASILEAIVHIRMGAADVVDLTQRAMAAARTHQLRPEMQAMPQMRGLLDCLDLTCALMQFNPGQIDEKMRQMQDNLDRGTRDTGWSKDGSFTVELCRTDNEDLDADANGIVISKNGVACLVMNWITNSQLYALAFLLSGLTKLHQNSSDGKVEEFLGSGLKMTKLRQPLRQSLAACESNMDQNQKLHVAIQLYLAFGRCAHGDWQSARSTVRELRKLFSTAGKEVDESTQRLMIYLEAVCRQGLGELKSALDLYESSLLVPDLETKAGMLEKDLRALATLNRVFIIRALGMEKAAQTDDLLAAVESYCLTHSNQAVLASFHLAKATIPESNPTIIKRKQYTHAAVQSARAAGNNQLLAIVMNLMAETYFRNMIVGEQAEKAAATSRSLAKRSRNGLWTVVADGLYGDIMERCGKPAEAEAARREAKGLYQDLPESLKQSL